MEPDLQKNVLRQSYILLSTVENSEGITTHKEEYDALLMLFSLF